MKIALWSKFKRMDHYEKLALALCLIIFVTLLIVSHYHKIGDYGVETDFYGSYAVEAFHILQGQKYQEPDHGPGYSLVLIPFYLLFRDMFLAGKILTIFSTVCLGFLTFKVFQIMFDSKLAFFTLMLLFIIIFPFSYLASNDLFFAFLTMLIIYMLFRKGTITAKNLFWAGLMAGYAFMTRLNAVVIPLVIYFIILFLNPEKWNWSKRAKTLALFSGAFLLTALPWLAMNYLNHGNPFASEAYQTIGVGMYKSANIAWAEDKNMVARNYDSIFAVLFTNPLHTVKFFLKNSIQNFEELNLTLIKFPAYLFVVPGAIILLSNINRRQLSLFMFPIFGFLIYGLIVFMPRFYLYIIAFFVFLIVYFLFQTHLSHERKTAAVIMRWLNAIAFAFTVLYLTNNVYAVTKDQISSDPVELLEISQWLKQESLTNETLIARKPHLGFISQMKVIYFPEVETLTELLNYAKAQGARLVLYSNIEAQLRPQLKILLEPDKLPHEFNLIYHMNNPKIFLYRINLWE